CCFIFFFTPRPPLRSTLFPYTTLFRSGGAPGWPASPPRDSLEFPPPPPATRSREPSEPGASAGSGRTSDAPPPPAALGTMKPPLDRKSTRLNSSHLGISYAVFCLKKKK